MDVGIFSTLPNAENHFFAILSTCADWKVTHHPDIQNKLHSRIF